MSEPSITVFVRKDGNDFRSLSFQRPEEVEQLDAIERGFAIDGRNVVISVGPDWVDGTDVFYRGPDGSTASDDIRPLAGVLRDTEAYLVKWLGDLGYKVEFA